MRVGRGGVALPTEPGKGVGGELTARVWGRGPSGKKISLGRTRTKRARPPGTPVAERIKQFAVGVRRGSR